MRPRRHRTFTSRLASVFASWGIRARVFWYRRDKVLLLGGSIAVLVICAFGFLLYSMTVDTSERQQLSCLALNVYFEARGEPEAGQYAVAEVTMNRVASPYYPDTVCGVVYQKNWDPLRKRYVSAFSWTEFTSLPEPRGRDWRRARKIAQDVYYRRSPPKLAGALHYHADHITPSWSQERTRIAKIGNHIFYR
jgi:N-acetylmuramoyl-L-alanine amidase